MSELLEVEPVAAGESGAEVDAEGGCHGAEGEAEGEDAGLAHRPTFASSRAPRWSEPSVSGSTVSFRRRSPCVTGQSMSRAPCVPLAGVLPRSEEHKSELQSLMRISYAVFCLTKKNISYT